MDKTTGLNYIGCDYKTLSMNYQDFFEKTLSLVGKEVELSTVAEPAPTRAKITNAMFDSFIADTPSGRRIVRFEDVLELVPLESLVSLKDPISPKNPTSPKNSVAEVRT